MGIGEGIVRAFVAEGARVIATARHADRGPALAAELGPAVSFRAFDISDDSAWRRLADELTDDPVNVLVNNGGGLQFPKRFHETEPGEFRREIEVNLAGPFFGMRYFIPHMLQHGGGSIINIGSMSATRGQPDAPAYQAAKGGLRLLTRNAAMAYATQGIRVNTVHPGVIPTWLQTSMPSEREQWFYSHIPMVRLGTPAEVAAAVVFLASDEASYITGIDLEVDGGFVL
jgi:3alpha(or 20beta)-hydroxysteroid dehydrogenase